MLSEVAGGSACTCCPIQRAQCLRPPAGLRHGVRTRSSSSSGPRDSLSESRICLTALQGLRCGADSGTQVSTVSGKLGRLLLAGGPSGALAAARPTRTHADAAAPSCAQETQPGAAGAVVHRVHSFLAAASGEAVALEMLQIIRQELRRHRRQHGRNTHD